MVDLGTYKFKQLDIGKIKHEELFSEDYAKEIYEA